MADQTNTEYFKMRAQDERLLGEQSNNPRAAAVHADMAARYDDLAADFEASRAALRSARQRKRYCATQPPANPFLALFREMGRTSPG